MRRINHHQFGSDEDSAPETILDTDDRPNCNGDLDNPIDSEEDCTTDHGSDTEQNNGTEDPECPEQHDVSGVRNVPRLVRPTRK